MLDPRIIRDRREEILHSCRIRNVHADVDAVLAEQEQTKTDSLVLGSPSRTMHSKQNN